MGGSEIGAGTDGMRGGSAGPLPDLLWRCIPIDGACGKRIRKSGPGESIFRVQLSRTRVQLKGFSCRRRGELVPEITPPKIEIVGFLMGRLALRERSYALRREMQPHLQCNRGAQLTLKGQHASRLTVIRFPPDLNLLPRADQLRGDA